MSTELEELKVVISAQISQFEQSINKMGKQIKNIDDKVSNSTNNINKSFSNMGKKIAMSLGAIAVGKFVNECSTMASDLQEVQNVISLAFNTMSNQVDSFTSTSITSMGLSETSAKKMIGMFGLMSKQFGFTEKDSLAMSETLTKLGADVSSAFNISNDEAFTKLKSVFTGETESLKEIGVVMTENALNQFAMAQGINKTVQEMSEGEKVALRYQFVLSKLSTINNDFANTSGGWANQIRMLKENFSSLLTTIGSGFIAVLTPVIQVINTILAKLNQLAKAVASVFGKLFGKSKSGTGGASTEIGDIGNSSSGINDTSNAIGGLSDNLEDAGKNAKETAKQMGMLMNIDEINTVSKGNNSNNNSNGSGSSGVGGVGEYNFSTPAIDTSETEGSFDKLTKTIERIAKEIFSPFQRAWSNMSEWFINKVNYFKNMFHEFCSSLSKFLISVWNNGGKEFVQHMAEIGLAIAGVALQIGGSILGALSSLWERLDPSKNSITQGFINAMNSLAVAVRNLIIAIGNQIQSIAENPAIRAIMQLISEIAMLIGTILAESLTVAIDLVRRFLDSWLVNTAITIVATALDIVLGVLKALLSVVRLFTPAFGILTVAFATFKAVTFIQGITKSAKIIETLKTKFSSLANIIKTNAIEMKNFYVSIKNGLVSGIKSAITGISSLITKMKTLATTLASNIALWVKEKAAIVASKIAKLADAAATTSLTIVQKALNLAMKANPVVLLVTILATLVTTIVVVCNKLGIFKAIWEGIKQVLSPIVDVLSWIWDKLKGVGSAIADFFGFGDDNKTKDELEDTKDTIDEVTESARTMDDAFGTSCSYINSYLDSINFNATKLAQQFEEAKNVCQEKIGMLSKNAQEYLEALASNDKEKLNEMSANSLEYTEEIKYMYAQMNDEQKNGFLSLYGVIAGVNDDILNYEGLSYDQRIAKHTAYCQSIQNNEQLTAQQKDQMIQQSQANMEQSIQKEIASHQELVNQKKAQLKDLMNSDEIYTVSGKIKAEELKNEIEKQQNEIKRISKSSKDEQIKDQSELGQALSNTSKNSKDAQKQSYQEAEKTCKESLKKINSELKNTESKIESFSSNTKKAFKSAFSGASDKCISELNKLKAKCESMRITIRVKIPHFEIYGNFNAQTKEVPRVGVSYYAKGGVVNKPTPAIFGEAGKEAVVPLERNTEWMDIITGRIVNGIGQFTQKFANSSQGSDVNNTGDIVLMIDGSVVGKVAIKELRKMQRQGNVTVIPT